MPHFCGTPDDDTLGIVTIHSTVSGQTIELAVTYDPRYPTADSAPSARQLLVGHTRVLLLPRAEHPRLPGAWCCGDPRLVGELIAEHGAALAVNPERQLVATLLATRIAERVGLTPANSSRHPRICLVDTISDCRLDEHGTLTTPPLRTLRNWEQQHGAISSAGGRRPRRATSKARRGTPSPPASAISVDALPHAAATDLRHVANGDINRIIISGQLSTARPHALAERSRWVLRVRAADARADELQIDVELPAGTAPSTGQNAVVQGRLTNRNDDGQIAIIADAVELCAAPTRAA